MREIFHYFKNLLYTGNIDSVSKPMDIITIYNKSVNIKLV